MCVCYSFSNFTSSRKRYDIINGSEGNVEPLNETPQQRGIYASPSHNLRVLAVDAGERMRSWYVMAFHAHSVSFVKPPFRLPAFACCYDVILPHSPAIMTSVYCVETAALGAVKSISNVYNLHQYNIVQCC